MYQYSGMASRHHGQISRLSLIFFVSQVSTEISTKNDIPIIHKASYPCANIDRAWPIKLASLPPRNIEKNFFPYTVTLKSRTLK